MAEILKRLKRLVFAASENAMHYIYTSLQPRCLILKWNSHGHLCLPCSCTCGRTRDFTVYPHSIHRATQNRCPPTSPPQVIHQIFPYIKFWQFRHKTSFYVSCRTHVSSCSYDNFHASFCVTLGSVGNRIRWETGKCEMQRKAKAKERRGGGGMKSQQLLVSNFTNESLSFA